MIEARRETCGDVKPKELEDCPSTEFVLLILNGDMVPGELWPLDDTDEFEEPPDLATRFRLNAGLEFDVLLFSGDPGSLVGDFTLLLSI